MIRLTRFDGSHFYINAEFIEFIEMTPDTVLSLIDHKKLLVRETADEVIDLILDYQGSVNARSIQKNRTVSYMSALPRQEMTEIDDAGHANKEPSTKDANR
jgi:flagellar protein FlbD